MFKEHKKIIDEKVKRKLSRVAKYIASDLVRRSPVWTGKYVNSMVVNTNIETYQRLAKRTLPPYPPKTDEMSAKLQAEQKLKANVKSLIKSGLTRIHFQNSAKHARFVEYLGWVFTSSILPTGEHKTIKRPQYSVFRKTAASTELRKKSL